MVIMPTQTESAFQTLDVEAAHYVRPEKGIAYLRPAYSISHSPIIITGSKSIYDMLEHLGLMMQRGEQPNDTRFPLESEMYSLESECVRCFADPRDAEVFGDYFGGNSQGIYVREPTLTVLRTPPGWENGRQDRDGTYPRLIVEPDWNVLAGVLANMTEDFDWSGVGDSMNKVVGEQPVPQGDWRVITRTNPLSGIPLETQEIPWPHKGYYAHFRLDPNPARDTISGHYDVAVGRWCAWRRAVDERCLGVAAYYGRLAADSFVGFRPVRGSVPEIKVVSSNVGRNENEFRDI